MINAKPERVFYYFEEIAKIPHGSYNVDAISDYIVAFAKEHNLRYVQDDTKNVIIYKAATKGYEDHDTIIIQGHMDMVAVKTPESNKDMDKEGLELQTDGSFIWAKDTSLGADDGIAVAYALAILESDEIEHPDLEVVITVNEEVGMDGALALDTSLLTGKKLLNIDSEVEGILTVGCAGGRTIEATLDIDLEKFEGNKYKINVSGLMGGHSGVMIHYGRANANVLIGCIIDKILEDCNAAIINIGGGEKGNAIPNMAEAIIVSEDDITGIVSEYTKELQLEYKEVDPDLTVTVIDEGTYIGDALSKSSTRKIVDILISEPDGVISYSKDIDGLVETSLNMGIMKLANESFTTHYELRSCVRDRIEELTGTVRVVASGIGFDTKILGSYPEWEFNRESKLLPVMKEEYAKQYGKDPVVDIIHAGLECGIFASKIEGFDAVSFGPNISDIHTTKEKLDIDSTKRVWDYILAILKL